MCGGPQVRIISTEMVSYEVSCQFGSSLVSRATEKTALHLGGTDYPSEIRNNLVLVWLQSGLV